jgi:sugar lactone lactonase YvrE
MNPTSILRAACILLLGAFTLHAGIPNLINYQGRLTDAQGNPVTGNRTMVVRVYDAPSGGNMTYEETIGTVAVANGTYSFRFGSGGDGVVGVLTGSDYLALSVNGTEESTRTRFLAVPYALKSADAQAIKQVLVENGILPIFEKSVLVTTLAGNGTSGFVDGTGDAAKFNYPYGIAVDSAGNVYVADAGNHRIRKITPDGTVTTLAGGGTAGSDDGTGAAARFFTPYGVAVDPAGNVYVAEYGKHRIRKITPDGTVTTLAGNGTEGFADGIGSAAMFRLPRAIAVDAVGNVYVADTGNRKVRKINPDGLVTTLAGSDALGTIEGLRSFADGPGTSARFGEPLGLAWEASGNLCVTDWGIRKITSEGFVSTVSRDLAWPYGVAIDAAGNIYVSDSSTHQIKKITPLQD